MAVDLMVIFGYFDGIGPVIGDLTVKCEFYVSRCLRPLSSNVICLGFSDFSKDRVNSTSLIRVAEAAPGASGLCCGKLVDYFSETVSCPC